MTASTSFLEGRLALVAAGSVGETKIAAPAVRTRIAQNLVLISSLLRARVRYGTRLRRQPYHFGAASGKWAASVNERYPLVTAPLPTSRPAMDDTHLGHRTLEH